MDKKTKVVYLTGGDFEAAKIVSIYSIKNDEWHAAPPLNIGRDSHASCCLGQHVFVFAGDN